jgi:hypothetical protein
MFNIIQDDTQWLLKRLTQIQNITIKGKLIPQIIAENFFLYYKQELANDNDLSGYTKELYEKQGEPKSVLRDSLKIRYQQQGTRYIATVGFDNPKSGMISKVQEYGTVITVTEKMRTYLATAGMPLRDETTHIEIPGKHAFKKAIARAREDYKRLLLEIRQSM